MSDLIGILVVAVPLVLLFLISEGRYRARRRRRMAERLDRERRVDAAWQMWCAIAARAVDLGAPVPPWREPR